MTGAEFQELLGTVRRELEKGSGTTDRERGLIAIVRALRVSLIDAIGLAHAAQVHAQAARSSLDELARASEASEVIQALRDERRAAERRRGKR